MDTSAINNECHTTGNADSLAFVADLNPSAKRLLRAVWKLPAEGLTRVERNVRKAVFGRSRLTAREVAAAVLGVPDADAARGVGEFEAQCIGYGIVAMAVESIGDRVTWVDDADGAELLAGAMGVPVSTLKRMHTAYVRRRLPIHGPAKAAA